MENYTKWLLNINIKDLSTDNKSNIFDINFAHNLHNDYINNREDKKHNIKSNSQRFSDSIKINHKTNENIIINKRKIVSVNFGINIWTEINGVRPAIIYKSSTYKYWEDIIVIPITSYETNKSIDEFDIILEVNEDNWLKNKSIIKIRQMRSISKKRIRKTDNEKIKILWEISENDIQNKIDKNIIKMLWILV